MKVKRAMSGVIIVRIQIAQPEIYDFYPRIQCTKNKTVTVNLHHIYHCVSSTQIYQLEEGMYTATSESG